MLARLRSLARDERFRVTLPTGHALTCNTSAALLTYLLNLQLNLLYVLSLLSAPPP